MMKKWVIGLLTAAILLLVFVYVIVPNTVTLKSGIVVKVAGSALHRMLQDNNNVAKWWPGKIANDRLYLNDLVYTIGSGDITVMPVDIRGAGINLQTTLFLTSIISDSIQLQWVGAMATSANPLARLRAWQKAKQINAGMDIILQKMAAFFSNPVNIYGAEIQKVPITDSLLIATSDSCKGFPDNQFIYGLIDKLQNYAAANAARQTSYPMVNIGTSDSISFEVKVAIPIDRPVPELNNFFLKRMPSMKPILMIEVKGGTTALKTGFSEIQKYTDDHQLKSAAIPFYSLVTDRTKEADTSKWVTRIYYPVMLYH